MRKRLRKKTIAKAIVYLQGYYAAESTELYDDETQEVLENAMRYCEKQIKELTGVDSVHTIPAHTKDAITFLKSL